MEQTGERTINLRGGSVRGEVSTIPNPLRSDGEYDAVFRRLKRDAERHGTCLGRDIAAGHITRRHALWSLKIWIVRADSAHDLTSEDMARLEVAMVRAVKTALAKAAAA